VSLESQIADFETRRDSMQARAHKLAAVRIACGIDLPENGDGERAQLEKAMARVERAIQRERMKAARAHWSYDLNRHIALKLARDDLRAWLGISAPSRPVASPARHKRRRRPQAPSISV